MPEHNFWERPEPHSRVKVRIVTKYFPTWARIIGAKWDKMIYMDLFAGKGKYDDGAPSTPLINLGWASKNPICQEKLYTFLNDADSNVAAELVKNIGEIPSIKSLKHQPTVDMDEIDDRVTEEFEGVQKLWPTFLFVDPFGMRGVSLALLKSIIRHDGTDAFLFFNYNFTNRFIDVDQERITDLFESFFGSKERLEDLRSDLQQPMKPRERERSIMSHLSRSFWEEMKAYSAPFRIAPASNRIYYLIGLTKSPLGYKIMKDIMAAESPRIEGIPLMEFNPKHENHQLLLERMGPLYDLALQLHSRYTGQTVLPEEMLLDHGIGKPYILANYKKACRLLYDDAKIRASREPKRSGTWADDIAAIFPGL